MQPLRLSEGTVRRWAPSWTGSGLTAADLFATFARQSRTVVGVGAHGGKEESHRIAHVDVLDRVEQRVLDGPGHVATKKQVVRRGHMGRPPRICCKQGLAHLERADLTVSSRICTWGKFSAARTYDQSTPAEAHIHDPRLGLGLVLLVQYRLKMRDESAAIGLPPDGVVPCGKASLGL